MVDGTSRTVPEIRELEAFLFREARLLDEQRYGEWLELFADDAYYWVPLGRGQDNPHDAASLLYDDRMSLEMRVRQLSSPRRHAQVPRTWTSHLIGNVTLEQAEDDGATVVVRSSFQVLEARRDKQRLLGGAYLHRLRRHGDTFKIAWKRVNLVNCDAVHDGFSVPI